jgi:hypothetical protein|tara:strand:- start:481 stop:1455 length:975 start_codon:yes stop_codon:yes gene_type:complete
MKISKLKQIIREEYHNVISEAFADPEIQKLSKMGGINPSRWTNFFKSFANTHNIAWDKLPKGTLNKTTNMNDPFIKDGLAFWVVDNDKENPYGGNRYFDRTLRKGVIAVTLKGKVQYYNRSSAGGGTGVGPKGMRKQGSAVGAGVRGTLQLKKLKELADSVYVMDFESFRGGTKALKAQRADLKLGKDKFKNARAWKQANLARYKSIIDARVGSRDQVDAMVAKIVKIANEAIQSGTELTKVGRYGDLVTTLNDKEVRIESVTNAMTRVLRMYAEYIRYENEEERSQGDYGAEYNRNRKRDVAGKIKKALNALEAGDERNIEYI